MSEKRIVKKCGEVWIATEGGMAAIGSTRKDAITRLKDCLQCKTALQVIHTWATFCGGRELIPKHVEKLTLRTLEPFKKPHDAPEA